MSNINNRQVLCDFWYFRELDDIAVPFEKYAEEKIGPRFARLLLRIPVLRALHLIWLGRDFPLIAPDGYGRLICVLQAILRNRNIFECIDIDVWRKGPIIAAAILFIDKYAIGPCMRASVLAVQVLTNRERQIFVERYGLPEDVLHTVPRPLSGWDSEVHNLASATRNGYVLASPRELQCESRCRGDEHGASGEFRFRGSEGTVTHCDLRHGQGGGGDTDRRRCGPHQHCRLE